MSRAQGPSPDQIKSGENKEAREMKVEAEERMHQGENTPKAKDISTEKPEHMEREPKQRIEHGPVLNRPECRAMLTSPMKRSNDASPAKKICTMEAKHQLLCDMTCHKELRFEDVNVRTVWKDALCRTTAWFFFFGEA